MLLCKEAIKLVQQNHYPSRSGREGTIRNKNLQILDIRVCAVLLQFKKRKTPRVPII